MIYFYEQLPLTKMNKYSMKQGKTKQSVICLKYLPVKIQSDKLPDPESSHSKSPHGDFSSKKLREF